MHCTLEENEVLKTGNLYTNPQYIINAAEKVSAKLAKLGQGSSVRPYNHFFRKREKDIINSVFSCSLWNVCDLAPSSTLKINNSTQYLQKWSKHCNHPPLSPTDWLEVNTVCELQVSL